MADLPVLQGKHPLPALQGENHPTCAAPQQFPLEHVGGAAHFNLNDKCGGVLPCSAERIKRKYP
jgi:hypothetical protein